MNKLSAMMTAKEIRDSFKSFFVSKGHHIVPSAPMVIKNDPTLMFTNAGMNQFKDIILGNAPIKYSRIADSQKCLRVSGKHNDLEEVGHDTYHHTMFEMLGNWSFGDYFKKEAISWAWEYLVDVLKLDPSRLYATIFEGSPEENLERDEEAFAFWLNYLPKERVLEGNKHDNFWEMGDVGPCGPCSEIHIDLRSEEERQAVDGATLVNKDHPQVIEIWNLVFMQYDRRKDGSLFPLPNKVIDTGMGFERLCMALQGKKSNYDTDAFQPLIKALADMVGVQYGEDADKDVAMRVISDHVRTIAFSITDGQLPSNAKAGYVIRRILRRAVRYGYTFLGFKEPFMYRLLPTLIELMGDAYPELEAQKTLIEKVIKEEEVSFLHTLETGIGLLENQIKELKSKGEKMLDGSVAFTLYDTYGFPLDLTELILREQGLEVNEKEFDVEMKKQKDRARSASVMETEDWVVLKEGSTTFVGYDKAEIETEILRYRKVSKNKKEYYQIVLSYTPFYAEMGGQVGDTGWLIDSENKSVEVIDTKSENNLPVHFTKRLPENLRDTFVAKINQERRTAAECNHSATHLLHEALRTVLGTHVEQKGSFVSPEVLRFDFSHFQKMTDEEIRKVEQMVTEKIRADYPLEERRSVPIAEAQAMGAMALFGEKYGEEVRVVRYGTSIELCGGTHIASTGHIGTFRIVSESSIASGVRRIEAVTAQGAENYLYQQADLIDELHALTNNVPNLVQTIRKSLEENTALKKQIAEFTKEKVAMLKEQLVREAKDVQGVLVIRYQGSGSSDLMKDLAFKIKGEAQGKSFFFVAGAEDSGKPSLTVMLSEDLVTEERNASKLIRLAAKEIQGGGGGQPHFATAGGKRPEGLKAAIDAILSAAGYN